MRRGVLISATISPADVALLKAMSGFEANNNTSSMLRRLIREAAARRGLEATDCCSILPEVSYVQAEMALDMGT